ncbi:hypothetical protein N665_2427s0002 [Sinapis alba]|nr:hypothetical protein N665_2427s0002 [Sinapis alba]
MLQSLDDEIEIVRNAGVVQLQREFPDSINIQVAKVCIKFVILLIPILMSFKRCRFRFR